MNKLHVKKLDNLEEMDTFLGTEDFPRWSHEEIDNLNKLISSTKNKWIIKINAQQIKVQAGTTSQRNSTKKKIIGHHA